MSGERENDESIITILDRKLNIQEYKAPLMAAGILNATSLFTTPLFTIVHQTSVPVDVCKEILEVVADKLVPNPVEISFTKPRERFNDPTLDQTVIIPESGIFEISGQAGAGKSNLAYQLVVNERDLDISKNVVVISTEGKVATERLWQMAQGKRHHAEEIMSGIIISIADSVDQLRNIIHDVLPSYFFESKESAPSLVVIDSIAALFRLEYDASAARERSMLLFDITTTLKWIGSTHNTLIVVTNQATANITTFATNSTEWVPALGLSWSNCVNVRVRVTKTQMRHEITRREETVVTHPRGERQIQPPRAVAIRSIYVDISPIKQDVKCQFYIDNDGVHGL